jgi:hypothetical protein
LTQDVRDVPSCFPFRGQYETGCEFIRNMCELSSYDEDPANPSWCSKYAADTLSAWNDCEFKVRTNSSLIPATRFGETENKTMHVVDRMNSDPDEFGIHFVSCFSAQVEEPQCSGMCAEHSGACQVLCPQVARCWSNCRGPGLNVHEITNRAGVQICMNDCLGQKPTPPPPNGTWPNTTDPAFPPETAAHQAELASKLADLDAMQARYMAEQAKLENATEVREDLRNQYKELLKQAMNNSAQPAAPAEPQTEVTTPAPAAAVETTAAPEAVTTPAPVGSAEDAAASIPALSPEAMEAVEQQTADVAAETAAVEAENANLTAEVAEMEQALR